MKSAFSFFTSNELKPAGWLRRQLELQANGLNGNLDKVWPDVRDSKWVGGDREGWERVPYWLDGFVPLAYLLNDDDCKARAQRYIDKIIENQEPDGWICPNGDTPREKYDTWAVILLSKVLLNYYECSGDKRIKKVLWRAMKNYYDLLSAGTIKLFAWAQSRWFEALITLNALHKWYPKDEWISSLAKILREQGTDWYAQTELWKTPLNIWKQTTHIVNVMMMLKYEAVSHELLGEDYQDIAEKLYDVLSTYNRTPVGTFTGDECLSGLSPIQGTELCAVVEQMYSFEWLYAVTGDRKWAERLETVAFNALPATISDDMWAHQYDQQSNQIECSKFPGKPVFRTNFSDANVFGLEPNFGCCTANFGQGWPKLTFAAFMKGKGCIASPVAIPSVLNTKWRGVPVQIALETDYPFRNRMVYRVNAEADTTMTLRIRIPSFAKNLKVNGETVAKKPWYTVSGFAAGETVIAVEFETVPEMVSAPNRLNYVRLGSLVFSVPISMKIEQVEYVRKEAASSGLEVERKAPYCDYYYYPTSDWNYAYASKELNVIENEVDAIPFSSVNPPVQIEAKVCHIDWGYEDGYNTICAKVPNSRKPLDDAQTIKLAPYGCAKLRMTEIPLIKK